MKSLSPQLPLTEGMRDDAWGKVRPWSKEVATTGQAWLPK